VRSTIESITPFHEFSLKRATASCLTV